MDSKCAVIYKSKYGSTKCYAGWIALKLGADLYELSDFRIRDIKKYDTIIYGGSIYFGKLSGIDFLVENYDKLKDKEVVLFGVGIDDDYKFENLDDFDKFYLRGSIDFKNISITDKIIINYLRSKFSLKAEKVLSTYENIILNQIDSDFLDKKNIDSIINRSKA